MPVKVKLANTRSTGAKHRILRIIAAAALICIVIGAIVFGYVYLKYQRIVDARLAAGPIFANVAQIYAAPREVRVGQRLSAAAIAQDLRRAGYNANPQLGTFRLQGDSISIKPGPESYHSVDGASITTGRSDDGGAAETVLSITAENGAALQAYELEPQLITALSEDKNRTKRRLVSYKEIPTELVQAVTSIEDRRFFEHH
jgi:penicillin-binding protein 1B